MNYLALIGWSPRSSKFKSQSSPVEGEPGAEELLPALELARRFRLEDVSHSAGVFDEAKLSWVNRHYLKALAPVRLTEEALPFLRQAALVVDDLTEPARDWLASALPPAAASVDRLSEVPDRLHSIFHFNAAAVLATPGLAAELSQPAARGVALALADDLDSAPPLLDRDAFRAAAARVKDRTGQKGRGLFHPIRVALTGLAEGPELDVLVPAIDRAAHLPSPNGLAPVVSCRDRARQIAALLPPG